MTCHDNEAIRIALQTLAICGLTTTHVHVFSIKYMLRVHGVSIECKARVST